MSASKIYIDPNEDIVFACSKIAQAPAGKVVLIVPHGSNIISSQVSVKLLAKILSTSEKLVVLVTEDELGQKHAEKAGLPTVTKVSEVEDGHWQQASDFKKQLRTHQDEKKAELVAKNNDTEFELVDREPKEEKVEAPVENETSTPIELGAPEEKKEEIEPYFKKLDSKVIEVEGYAILSGGDISEEEKSLEVREKLLEMEKKDVKPEAETDIPKSEGQTAVAVPVPVKAGLPVAQDGPSFSERVKQQKGNLLKRYKQMRQQKPREVEPVKVDQVEPKQEIEQEQKAVTKAGSFYVDNNRLTETNFARGYDRLRNRDSLPRGTRVRASEGGTFKGKVGDIAGKVDGQKIASAFAPVKSVLGSLMNSFSKGTGKKKAGMVAAILLVIMMFMMLFTSPKAKMRLVVEQQSIPVSENVSAVEGIQTANLEELKVPLRYITKSDSRSETGTATGTGEDGKKATGEVKIFNYNSDKVTLEAGTVLTSVNNSLDYRLSKKVVVDAVSEYSGTVKIEAAGFGEEYNLSKGKKDFSVKGGKVKDVSIFAYSGVAGGEKEEVTVVAQSDIDTLKTELTNVLKQSLGSDVNSLVSDSEIRLTEDVTFNEPKVEVSAKAGDKEEFFDITVSMEAKVAVVERKYLEELALELVKKNSALTGDFKVEELQDPQITDIKLSEGKISFKLSASAEVTAGLTEDDVKGKVKGLSISDAREQLANLENVKQSELEYSPGYMPGFMKKVPQDDNDLQVEISN